MKNNKMKRLLLGALTVLLSVVTIGAMTMTTHADENPASWVLCQFEDGRKIYNLASTDDLAYALRSKSSTATSQGVDNSFMNNMLEVGGHDFTSTNESILGRPLRPVNITEQEEVGENGGHTVNPFDRFGVAGLTWSSYGGEWKYSQVDACTSKVANTNYGQFYEGRQEPKSAHGEVSTSSDIRSNQFNKGVGNSWANSFADTIANGVFSVTKFIVTLTITIVSISFTDLTSLLGLSPGSGGLAESIFNGLFTVFQTFIIVAFIFTALSLLYKAIVKREIRAGLQMLLKSVVTFMLAYVIASNPAYWVSMPNKIATAGQGLVLNALSGTLEGSSDLCGTQVGDIKGDGLEAVGSNMRSVVSCRMWEEMLFKPWVQGQYGTTYENLNADKLGNVNTDWTGDLSVPMGDGSTINNLAMFQLSTQTNAHSTYGAPYDMPHYVTGVNADWWRVVDVLSNYQEERVTETPPGGSASVSYVEQTDTKPLAYWDSWVGNDSSERVGVAFLAMLFGTIGSLAPLVLGFTSAIMGIGVTLLMIVSPLFLMMGTAGDRGQQAFTGWLQLLISTIVKKIIISFLVVLSFTLLMGVMKLVNVIGWFQSFLLLSLVSLVIVKNKNKILSAFSSINLGTTWTPGETFGKNMQTMKQKATNMKNVGVASVAGAKAAHDTGQSIADGARIGAKSQLRNTMYQSKAGRSAILEMGRPHENTTPVDKCMICGTQLYLGSEVFVDEVGNMYCKFCGDDTSEEYFKELVLTEYTEQQLKNNGTRDVEATNNKSWLRYSAMSEGIDDGYYDKDATQDIIYDNLDNLSTDMVTFAKHRKTHGTHSLPPAIPEPLQKHLDLALVNEAWTMGKYNYIDQVYREAWSAWYEENQIEGADDFRENIMNYQGQSKPINDEEVTTYVNDDDELYEVYNSKFTEQIDVNNDHEIDKKHALGEDDDNPRNEIEK